jgi:hypothetical protein
VDAIFASYRADNQAVTNLVAEHFAIYKQLVSHEGTAAAARIEEATSDLSRALHEARAIREAFSAYLATLQKVMGGATGGEGGDAGERAGVGAAPGAGWGAGAAVRR